MKKAPVKMNPAQRRDQWERCANARMPEVPSELRPPLYPGRELSLSGGVSPDRVPPIVDGPLDFIPFPNL